MANGKSEKSYHVVTPVEESRYHGPEHDMLPLNFLEESFDLSLLPDNAIWPDSFVKIQAEYDPSVSVVDTITARIADEKNEVGATAPHLKFEPINLFRHLRSQSQQHTESTGFSEKQR